MAMFQDKYRYFILVLSWFCLSSICSNMIALNFTLICMSVPALHEDEYEKPYIENNATKTQESSPLLQTTPLSEISKMAPNETAPPLILNTTHLITEWSKTDLASEVRLKTSNETILGIPLNVTALTGNSNITQSPSSQNTSDDQQNPSTEPSRSRRISPIESLNTLKETTQNAAPKRTPPIGPTVSVHGPEHAPVFDYSSQQKAQLMWAVGAGAIIGTLPFSWLSTRYGARFVLFGAGLLSCAATALIPMAAVFDFKVFLLLRFFQGCAYAADFVSIGMICSRWASLKQYAFFMAVLVAPLGTTTTNLVSGMICESSFGWPMVFYAHAAVGLVLMVLWVLFYNDHPNTVSQVTEIELEKINRNKTKAHIEMDPYIPYKEILTDKVIWTVWINAFVEICTTAYLAMYLPSYLKFVLNYGVQQTGLLAAIPTFILIPTRIGFGYLSDKIKCISERVKLVLYNTIALAMTGIIFSIVGFIPGSAHPVFVVLLFIVIHMFLALTPGAFYKCGALYSRQYYHFVSAILQIIKCLSVVVGPLLMTILVRDETEQSHWRKIFILFGVLLFSVNILFCIFATASPGEFTKHPNPKRRRSSVGLKKLSATLAGFHGEFATAAIVIENENDPNDMVEKTTRF